MALLGRRRVNGVPLGAVLPAGQAPSSVGALAAGTPSSTTLPLTYTAATGSATVVYSGWTSAHGSGGWTQNSGLFSATGGVLVGLAPGTTYDLRIVATNGLGSTATDLLGGVTTALAAASSFTLALSATSGAPGAPVVLTASPSGGSWPSGEVVTPSSSGLSGAFDSSSLVGNGVAPLSFTFTPVSGPGTSGNITAVAAGMMNTTGAQAYSVAAVTVSSKANRYDIVVGTSAAAAGTAVQTTIYPNGSLPAGTITLSGTNGAFSPSATINLTQGSTAPITVTYTPASAGEHGISGTNTAGLYDPYGAPLSVFTPGSGTARSLAASLTRADLATYQRDTASGNPAGFSVSWARGWGEVWFNVTSIAGATNGLWVRLYDAASAGVSSAVGTGTVLHPAAVQVYGAVSGTGTIRILLPAGPYIYYADLASDAAFTNPIRIPQRFKVGVVIGHNSRSQESGLSRSYAYNGNVPLPTNYIKAAAWVGYDYRYSNTDSGWFVHDGATVDPYQYHYGEGSSSGTQEMGRLIESQLGVCVGITGSSATAGGLDSMVNHDGSLAGGFAGTVATSVGGKFRYLWMATGLWDGVDQTNYPNETYAENRTRYMAAVDWVARNFPACAVIGWVTGASGVFGGDGSRTVGFTRNQTIFLKEIEPVNPMVVSKECYHWNEYNTGHSTMAARVQYVRAGFRSLMAAELSGFGGFQTSNRGPTLAAIGTIRNGTRTISIPYTMHGGSALQAVGINFSNPNYAVNTASNAELASLFSVYQSGGFQGNGTAIKVDAAAINSSAGTIDLTLSGASGVTYVDNSVGALPTSLSVHYAADFGVSNGSAYAGAPRAVMLADDRVDTTNGIPYGWHMRPALDISITTI